MHAALPCPTVPKGAYQSVTTTNNGNYPSTAVYSCADGYVLTKPQYATRNCILGSSGPYWEVDATNYPPSCIGKEPHRRGRENQRLVE